MKRMLLVLLALLLLGSNAYASELLDIENHWAKDSINRLILQDSIIGYEDGTFKPDNNITVAEFIKILVQYAEYKKVLIGEMWPDWYINTAKYYGLILENEFDDYDKFITRYEAATIISRFVNEEADVHYINVFCDTANEDVLKLAHAGVINGYSDGTFRGENNITRAEAAIIICRAMKVRREVVANKKYDLSNAEKLTNIGRTASYDSDYINRYEINNEKIYFYDTGRYAKLDGYVVEEKNIKNKTIINLIKSLIQEDAYVAVSYVPDKLTYDQIVVDYGRREGYVYNNSYTFGFVFYPGKQFELSRSAVNDKLSKECFMKISVSRMWKDVIDMKNGEYAHELNNEKLLKSLREIFDNESANEIYNYIQKWIPILFEKGHEKRFIDIKRVGKYTLNLYTKSNGTLEIYIAK